MSYSKPNNIWVIINHPWQLLLALALRAGYQGQGEWHLLISRHEYWMRVDPKSYSEKFASVTFFDEPERAHSVRQAILFLRACRKIRGQVRRLIIQPNDCFITLSYWKYVENFITSSHPKVRSLFICREDVNQEGAKSLSSILRSKKFRISKSGWLQLILEILLGLRKHTILYWIRGKEQTHGVAFTRPFNELYDEIFILKSLFESKINANEIYFPYCLLNQPDSAQEKKQIVFLLSGFIRNEGYYKKIYRVLAILKNRYGESYRLVIRLHPGNPNEHGLITASGWEINKEPGNVEQYFLRHKSEIAAAFSHLSSGLIFAANIGIPAYSYHRCFSFEPSYLVQVENMFSGLPPEFFLARFDDIPKSYSFRLATQEAVKNSLEHFYNSLT